MAAVAEEMVAVGKVAPELARWRSRCAAVVALRVACLSASVLSLALMVSSQQSGTLSVYGFHLPVHAKWSFSESFEYLVAVVVVAAAHSVVQVVAVAARGRPSRRGAAGSAASGVTNLNRTGIRHAALPDFCRPLRRFCVTVAASIAFSFLAWLLLAASAVLDVLSICNDDA
ncbi:unnamed protein product [Spirodela intermedia]|uniref:CASP-like protein n=1 Tax=Spirodela intermedia TaxID=51605 RepID=A0A7I8KJR9_SPIIN|nr:unnamed protein product [Spirodela intermedia]